MRRIVMVFWGLLIMTILYSQDFVTYNMELVKKYPIKLGFEKSTIKDEFNLVHNGPRGIAFDKSGNLYIGDTVNRRLVKFDRNYNYITEYNDVYSSGAKQIFITDKHFVGRYSAAFCLDDRQGNKIAFITLKKSKKYKNKAPSLADFIYLDNLVITYLKDGSMIGFLDPTSDIDENLNKIIGEEEVLKYLTDKQSMNTRSVGPKVEVDNNKKIIIDGEIQTGNFSSFYNFKKSQGAPSRGVSKHAQGFTDEILTQFNGPFLGKDSDGNSYWWGGNDAILIFSPSATLIKAFKYDSNKSRAYPTIHPSGDVYFMNYDDKGVYLYKVNRVW